MKFKTITVLLFLFCCSQLTPALPRTMDRPADERSPDLPAACSHIQAEQGSRVVFHAYAIGVQVYRWNGAAWDFVAPEANLYADAKYRGQVGVHYAGPKWESNSGGWVQAQRLDGCDLDPANAIPWLLLERTASDGPGVFSSVTQIQRVNTSGGVKPTAGGSYPGEIRRVPYTAEYYFYRGGDDPQDR